MLFGRVWSFLLLAAYLAMPRLVGQRKMAGVKAGYLVIACVALTARLVPCLMLPADPNFDIQSYQLVGKTLLGGTDVYSNPETESRHPYLPFSMYWMAASQQLSNVFQLPFTDLAKLVPILADAAVALIIYACLMGSFAPEAALLGGLLYAVNPVPVFVSAYHGQFDAVPALFTLLSLFWLNRSALAAGGWLGLGILSKSWPVLALPSLLAGLASSKKRLVFLAASLLVPLLALLFYAAHMEGELVAILRRAIGYNWGVGVWGYTYFIRLLSIFQPAMEGLFSWFGAYGKYVTLTGLGLVWWFRARKQAPKDGILTVLVAFFAITNAFSIQYLVWVVPFAVLNREDKWLKRYTIAAFLYMFLVYNTLILETHITKVLPWPQANWFIIIPASLPVWLVTVGWAVERIFPGEWEKEALQKINTWRLSKINLYIVFTSLALIIGSGIRLLQLGKQRLFIDEAYAWAASKLPVIEILRQGLQEPHPGLYYLLLKFYLVFVPATQSGLRGLSTVFSIASLGMVAIIAARWWNLKAAFFASLLLAISSFDIYYAQEARMYTTLGLFWILSYILLVEALNERPRLLLGWGLVNALMLWTHLYGLPVVFIQVALLLLIWGWRRCRRQPFPIADRWLFTSLAIVITSSLPVLYLALRWRANINAGGWIPTPSDLRNLYSLIMTGLAAGRANFLDGDHLVIPPLAILPGWWWFILSLALVGAFALWALAQDLRKEGPPRWRALFAVSFLALPIFIYLYSALFQRQQWAFKPFLGLAYVVCLWAGAGLSRAPGWIRLPTAAGALAVSIVSIIPYFSAWQKAPASEAFATYQPADTHSALLLDAPWVAPVPFYYSGVNTQVFGIKKYTGDRLSLIKISSYGIQSKDYRIVTCSSPELKGITTLWIYDYSKKILESQEKWPACLANKSLYVFENGKWIPLRP